MKKQNIIDLIKADEYSIVPKYLQIANSVIREIENGHIYKGDSIPSVNKLSIELDIARGTVEKGYNYLKDIGIIDAVPKKGYYISNVKLQKRLKVFLLFNKLSTHKKAIYDSFISTIGKQAVIDFYIYNNDFALFKELIENKKNDYTHYVIIPHYMEGEENGFEILNTIPKEKLLLLDKVVPGITGEYAAAYENFESDIYSALVEANEQLSKYHTLKIVFPSYSYYPSEILRGFKNYCKDHGFVFKVVSNIQDETVQSGEVYINVMEDDLAVVLEKLVKSGLTIGKELGVISYNETPVKKFILNGITTISTNFNQMGAVAAEMILSNSKDHTEIPFKLTLRASL